MTSAPIRMPMANAATGGMQSVMRARLFWRYRWVRVMGFPSSWSRV